MVSAVGIEPTTY